MRLSNILDEREGIRAKKSYISLNPNQEKVEIPYDTLVSATGLKSNDAISNQFNDVAKKVVKIGDARQAKKIFECFHQAWQAIREL